MSNLIRIEDVDNLIIRAIEDTNLPEIPEGPQSEVWDKIYKALNDLRELANKTELCNDPYLRKTVEVKLYNSEYGDERVCQCGHKYYRHFDSYEDMEAIGCKYCSCYEFVEKIDK